MSISTKETIKPNNFPAESNFCVWLLVNLYIAGAEVDQKNNVFTIDATVIDVCLSAFSWAQFETTKGAVKVHVQLDLKTATPEVIQITPASDHEANILDNITFKPDSFYVIDYGYIDFGRLYNIHRAKAFLSLVLRIILVSHGCPLYLLKTG